MKQTFAQIETLAMHLKSCNGDDRNHRIQMVVSSAQENAHTTCYEEKAAPVSDYEAVALATLECNLSYCDDMEVCAWFAENDVKW